MNINIMITGPVSAGKSTLTNLLFVDQYSDMKIKRTTALPQIYHECDDIDKMTNVSTILERNRQINTEYMQRTDKLQSRDIQEVEYYVPKVFDFLELNKDITLTVYDTPGLNDSRTKDVYYEYINGIFNRLDVIVFVLDIYSAMNTSDEVDILKMIITNIRTNKEKYNIDTHLVVLLNKCDDMSLNKETGKYCLDAELQEMYDQADSIIKATVTELYNSFKYTILPISCEDSYVYRMYKRNANAKLDEKHLNKFGCNEYGKSKWNMMSQEAKQSKIGELFKDFNYEDRLDMTGFKQFRQVMQNTFNNDRQYQYLLNHIKYRVNNIVFPQSANIVSFTQAQYNPIHHDVYTELEMLNCCSIELDKLIVKFDKPISEFVFLYETTDGFITQYIQQFTDAFWQNLKVNKFIDIYDTIYKNYITFKQYFIDTRVYVDNKEEFAKFNTMLNACIKQVIKCINIYWIEKMDNPNINKYEILSYFDKLYANRYSFLHELIVRKLSNVQFYTNIFANHYYTDEVIDMLDVIEKRYNFKGDDITNLAITIATNTYLALAPKEPKILNILCSYWQPILIKTTNKYYNKILCFKNTFNVSILTMTEYLTGNIPPAHYMTDYIYNRVKNEFPNEITTCDAIIDNIFNTKKE